MYIGFFVFQPLRGWFFFFVGGTFPALRARLLTLGREAAAGGYKVRKSPHPEGMKDE